MKFQQPIRHVGAVGMVRLISSHSQLTIMMRPQKLDSVKDALFL